ncbi:dTDP-4-dehydro-6-deoxyglucose aminotransferase [Streptomyces eurythermus]|uniref:dTDP-4-dehydro-6-deoxyglucose aminotransferase n=1 Tax=Streptomyces eurythermus TaxID=42237 RepID=UPI0036F4EF36
MKRGVHDLALFGGDAAFLQPLYMGRPNTGDRKRLLDRLEWALDNRWLTNGGPLVREFEQRIADLAGVRNCVATCNATAGLQLLLREAEVTGEVIMPSMTFVATAHAVRWLGLRPVFCDIDPDTGCLDPKLVEAAVTPRTGAILGVHLWGRPSPVDELAAIAAEHGLKLFYDAAHALGCTSRQRRLGSFGDAEVFSFHATKVVNSFEGGGIVTDDDTRAERLRALHNFGLGHDGVGAGINAKMSEAAAAMGLTSLEGFADAVASNRANYELYRQELSGLPGVRLIDYDPAERNNYHYVIALIDAGITGLHRDLLLTLLRAENVVAQPYFSPGCHQREPYRTEHPVSLPHTEHLAEQVIALPTGPAASREDIRRVCDIIRVAAAHGPRITAQAGA